jgi:hypothetical protein
MRKETGTRKGTGELRRKHVWGLTLGKDIDDELVLNIPKVHNDNDYIQYEIETVPGDCDPLPGILSFIIHYIIL